MTLEPASNGIRTAIFKNINHSAALQINQYCAIACSLELAPVVNAHHPNRVFGGVAAITTLQCANNCIVASCQTKTRDTCSFSTTSRPISGRSASHRRCQPWRDTERRWQLGQIPDCCCKRAEIRHLFSTSADSVTCTSGGRARTIRFSMGASQLQITPIRNTPPQTLRQTPFGW